MSHIMQQQPLQDINPVIQPHKNPQKSIDQEQQDQNILQFSNYLTRLLSPEESKEHMEFEEEQFSQMCDSLFENTPMYFSNDNQEFDTSDNSSDDCCVSKLPIEIQQKSQKILKKPIKKQDNTAKKPTYKKKYIRKSEYLIKQTCNSIQNAIVNPLQQEKSKISCFTQNDDKSGQFSIQILQNEEIQTKNEEAQENKINSQKSDKKQKISSPISSPKSRAKKMNKKYKKKKWSPKKYNNQNLLNEIQGSIIEFNHDSYDFTKKIKSFITFSLNYEEMQVYTKFQDRYVRKSFQIKDISYDVSYDFSNLRINTEDRSYEYNNIEQTENIKKIIKGITIVQQKQAMKYFRDFYNKNVQICVQNDEI